MGDTPATVHDAVLAVAAGLGGTVGAAARKPEPKRGEVAP
jgi:hypothetical protein